MGDPVAEASLKEAFGNGAAYSHNVALTERAGSVFNTAFRMYFGVSGSHAAPLTELFEFVNSVFAGKGKYGVEHRRHVTGIKEEAVACDPCGIVRIGH